MQKLKELASVLVLVILLAVPAMAGEIDIPGPPPPPPPASNFGTGSGDIHIPGEIQPGRATQGPSSAGAMAADVAMNLLQELLLVF